MKNEKYMYKILKKLVSKENIENLSKYLIYPDDKGYVMYGEYIISKLKNDQILVKKDKSFTKKTFNSLRNAIIWATFDKSNKIMESKKIEELDTLISCIDANIDVQRNLLKGSKNLESVSLAHTKITEESNKKSYLLQELDSLIYMSKMLQEQHFGKLIN